MSSTRSLAGRPEERLLWQQVLTGTKPDPRDLRHFVLVQPFLDYSALEPGRKADRRNPPL